MYFCFPSPSGVSGGDVLGRGVGGYTILHSPSIPLATFVMSTFDYGCASDMKQYMLPFG